MLLSTTLQINFKQTLNHQIILELILELLEHKLKLLLDKVKQQETSHVYYQLLEIKHKQVSLPRLTRLDKSHFHLLLQHASVTAECISAKSKSYLYRRLPLCVVSVKASVCKVWEFVEQTLIILHNRISVQYFKLCSQNI